LSFPLNIYAAAAIGGWLVAFLTLPLWRAWCQRRGLVDDPGHRKIHREPVPLAGGLAVLTGMLLPILAAAVWLQWPGLDPTATSALAYGLERRLPQLLGLLAGAVGVVALGYADDRYELRPGVKFVAQALVAAVVAAAGIRISLFVPNLLVSHALTILWLVTVMNALNFLDNMNGLCAGLGAIGAFWFGLKAAVGGQYLVAAIAFLSCGSLLGFLPYNYPRATVFLGDAGSHLVGYVLGVLAILPHFYTVDNPRMIAVLNPFLVLAVPLADMVYVVCLRWRQGRPFYEGDTHHLSHRLVRRGLSPARAVLCIWLLAAVTGAFIL